MHNLNETSCVCIAASAVLMPLSSQAYGLIYHFICKIKDFNQFN